MAGSVCETEPLVTPNPLLQSYYESLESRIGYRLILGGTRHFGYYNSPWSFPFPIGRALRRMEDRLFENLQLPAGSHILDAGCGVAHVALHMARHGMRVTGIDVLDSHLKKAERNIARSELPPGRVGVQKMDYHHLESIAEESYDGAYTVETFVHAADPEAVLAGFYRILRPGGRVALFEYDHILDDSAAPRDLWESLTHVNDMAYMPTYGRSTPGQYQTWLEEAGFRNVVVRDYSKNVRPMLRLFWLLALIPHFFVKLFRLENYFVNTIAGYQGYRGQAFWRYVAVTATKPGGPLEGPKTK